MNIKKIKLNDCYCNGTMPLRDTLPASSDGLPSASFHQQQYGDASWPREEYCAVAALRSAFAQSCVGSSTAVFNAPENLSGMAQFDLPPFEMLPPTANRMPFRSSTNIELFRQLDPLILHADQSSSCDAAELPLLMPQQHQERAHHHGLFVKAATYPVKEAPGSSLQNQMESPLTARSCVGAPGTASHAGTSSSNDEPPAARPRKTRIRWTQDLHERFVECVNQLGGAEKATPKGILKLMNSDGLTIYHIKSHLQKYRMPPPSSPSENGQQHEKWGDAQNPELKIGMHIAEALRVQLHMQRRLFDQLEMQRCLQVRIEEQGKMLQKIFEEQLKASGDNAAPSLPDPDNDVLFPAVTADRDDAMFIDTDNEMQLMSAGSGSYDDEF